MSTGDKLETITTRLEHEGGGHLGVAYIDHRAEWLVAVEWGQEAEDSPMAGAASYGTGDTLEQALDQVLAETGWSR